MPAGPNGSPEDNDGGGTGVEEAGGLPTKMTRKQRQEERPFVFANYPSRKVAIRLAYHGHLYDGLAKQEETSNTVEAYVVAALRRVRLIPQDGPSDLARCGRTDKGVSALGNAFSLTVRASSWPTDSSQKPPLDYCAMVNSALPVTIRVVGWAYVDDSFDARFSCVGRTYRYYFCHRGLNLEAMANAAARLKGRHNFRNFCKTDVVNVSNYERDVRSVGIVTSETLPELVSYFEIHANSFLYHQIRCTMEVLFLVGRGLEEPEVVTQLLERGDRKPLYPLADGRPLVLWDCHFEGLRWSISQRAFMVIEQELQDIATALLLRASVADSMRSQLFTWYSGDTDVEGKTIEASPLGVHVSDRWSVSGCDWTDERTHVSLRVRRYDLFALSNQKTQGASGPLSSRSYTKLLDRETERSFDEEVEALSEKKRARFESNMEKKQKSL
ncbi:putative pseudouridine synthase A-like protein [Trypanosoma rangeli]|uniref:tRNA pseudouridine synthase n=1 Tax=Trypanosoma rangeli TaxID=5698 RepID=A0A422P3K1_TRYRA|nr:putative pseudouridine synthase A-like protein [Trypanosoma rangeli]RNF12289.1 putative pseudouridine synthase A-like protein [Trypanosoma rangeli]|eukprot:RNF12289.1 putative pseudouridine synthase A-like protein [Trypanosoma rangeli]